MPIVIVITIDNYNKEFSVVVVTPDFNFSNTDNVIMIKLRRRSVGGYRHSLYFCFHAILILCYTYTDYRVIHSYVFCGFTKHRVF